MSKHWTRDRILDMACGFRRGGVLMAAAQLGVFDALKTESLTAKLLAEKISVDKRTVVVLLDALVAMQLLAKRAGRYHLPGAIADLLTKDSDQSILAAVLHQGNCLRRWAWLAEVVKNGRPVEHAPSIRGEAADLAAFVGAMDVFSSSVADEVISELGTVTFRRMLDVGGGPGTWTIGFLQKTLGTKAIIFDLPQVIPMAKDHINSAGLADRVEFVAGDYLKDDLPSGADFVWLSAICHQNSRQQNQELFCKIYNTLPKGGIFVIRDVVMEKCRTKPIAGAFFAINMLVGTETGGTFTFDEFEADLLAAGFGEAALLCKDKFMNSLVRAAKG